MTAATCICPEIKLCKMLTPDILLEENMEFIVPWQLQHQHSVWAYIEQCNRGLANRLLVHMSRFATHAKFSPQFNPVSCLNYFLIAVCIVSAEGFWGWDQCVWPC